MITPRDDVVLDVRDLRVQFSTRTGIVKAVDGVSFAVHEGETLGVVGESGSGKSVTALAILGLVPKPAGHVAGGVIELRGENLLAKSPAEMARIRGRQISMIPQDPMTSLNPAFSIGNQLLETLTPARRGTQRLRERAVELLRQVRVPDPERRLNSYPHQLSGGTRQRVVGAISMSRGPRLLIADEPTTSLDATIQFQYLELLQELQRTTGMAILFITHDFGVVAKMCDRVAVMYAGKVVETSSVDVIFDRPSHPYTEALLRSVPSVDVEVTTLYSIAGQAPRPDELPVGCAFEPRCPFAVEICRETYPDLAEVEAGHKAACWRPGPHLNEQEWSAGPR